MLGSNSSLPACNATEQLNKLFALTAAYKNWNDNGFYAKLGCMSPCNKVT